jgi:hypothetical protein
MNTNRLTTSVAEPSQYKATKIAGFFFLFIVIGWTLNWMFIDAKINVAGNVTATANNIMANELLVRVGIFNEMLFSISGFLLALVLYKILKPISKNLALLALSLKLIEAILSIINVLITFIVLLMFNGKAYLKVIKPEQLQDIVGLFFNIRTNGATISMVFLGLGFIIFLYLLYKSNYVPKILAGFGILSYSLILINAIANILIPQNLSVTTIVNTIGMIFMSPSILFELMIGLWLLIKGIKISGIKS